ncbi:hypothetical protein [Xenorhabdus indica]|uniref:hypothetical protein n=1 Tax=Xenorhabdus indica TaxID=333964 RepID=UPI001CA389D7|nr:hypothetical protein [Xenorhabdus indica]
MKYIYQCVCFRLFYGGSGRGGFSLAGRTLPVLRTLFELPPLKGENKNESFPMVFLCTCRRLTSQYRG